MLKSDDAQGTDYIAKLCASAVTDAVVLDNDAEAADGTQDTAMVYANGILSCYEQSARVADGLVGIRGTLLLDKTGKVSGFLPGRHGQQIRFGKGGHRCGHHGCRRPGIQHIQQHGCHS